MSGSEGCRKSMCVANHDTLFYFCEEHSNHALPRSQYLEYSKDYITKKFTDYEPDGRRYRLKPVERDLRKVSISCDAEGRMVESKTGYLQIKFYLEEMRGVALDDVWIDIQEIRTTQAEEDTGYRHSKARSSARADNRSRSNEGGLVADFFCGSGTTGAVAETARPPLDDVRPWAASAIHTSRKRLIELQRALHDGRKIHIAPSTYTISAVTSANGGRRSGCTARTTSIARWCSASYKAEPLPAPTPLLHGRKGRAFVHVDAIDSILTREELRVRW